MASMTRLRRRLLRWHRYTVATSTSLPTTSWPPIYARGYGRAATRLLREADRRQVPAFWPSVEEGP